MSSWQGHEYEWHLREQDRHNDHPDTELPANKENEKEAEKEEERKKKTSRGEEITLRKEA